MAGIDSNAKIALHMDGADTSTTFTDDSLTPHTFTAHASAQIDTAQSVFGGASGLFTRATADWIDTPDSADFAFGSGNFTIECRFRLAGNQGQFRHISGQNDNGFGDVSYDFYINTSNQLTGRVYSGGTQYAVTGSTGLSLNTWYHGALVRAGNNLNLYLDGVAEGGTTDVTGITVNNSSSKLSLGRTGELVGNEFDGWIDEFRLSVGIARWTANFTPPSAAYSPDAGASIIRNMCLMGVG